MACLDHACRPCGHGWSSNRADENCTRCGSADIKTEFDEPDSDGDFYCDEAGAE